MHSPRLAPPAAAAVTHKLFQTSNWIFPLWENEAWWERERERERSCVGSACECILFLQQASFFFFSFLHGIIFAHLCLEQKISLVWITNLGIVFFLFPNHPTSKLLQINYNISNTPVIYAQSPSPANEVQSRFYRVRGYPPLHGAACTVLSPADSATLQLGLKSQPPSVPCGRTDGAPPGGLRRSLLSLQPLQISRSQQREAAGATRRAASHWSEQRLHVSCCSETEYVQWWRATQHQCSSSEQTPRRDKFAA